MTAPSCAPQHLLDLKRAGARVIGYYCCFMPVELLTAAHAVPFRIAGDPSPQTPAADGVLEKVMCPWVRNTLEMAMAGSYSFLDGIVIPHACDAVQHIYGFWKEYVKLPFIHYLEVPHTLGDSSYRFYAEELGVLRKGLESFTGQVVSNDALNRAIEAHNINRGLVQQLYSLRRLQPPLVSARETLHVLKTGMRQPVADFNCTLVRLTSDSEQSRRPQRAHRPRLLASGCVIDSDWFFSVVEECGADVVMDDLPVGTRSFWFHVDADPEPLDALARSYLKGVRCPRTIGGKLARPHREELKDRLGYLLEFARDYRVEGIILNLMHYCDCHEFDMPDVKQFLQEAGYPVLTLDDDYSGGSLERLRTRIEAFLELMKNK